MDVKQLCRICLNEPTENMISIFIMVNQIEKQNNEIIKQIWNTLQNGITFSSKKDLTINDMISVLSSFGMTNTDGFPDKMCTDCFTDLCLAYSFKLRCNDAHHKIRNLLCQHHEQHFDNFLGIKNSNYPTATKSNECLDEIHSIFIKTEELKEDEHNLSEFRDITGNAAQLLDVSLTGGPQDTVGRNYDEFSEDSEIVEAMSPGLEDNISDVSSDFSIEHAPIDQTAILVKCFYCPKEFSRSKYYVRHLKKHKEKGHDIKQPVIYQCPQCSKIYKDSYALFRHVMIHSDHKCKKCGKIFRQRFHLYLHRCPRVGENLMDCQGCGRDFVNENDYEKHVMLCKGKQLEGQSVKKFECEYCFSKFTAASSLKKHILLHQKTNDCNTCGKKFETSRELNEHTKEHASERPFLCSECGSRFKNKVCLDSHQRSHTGERPFKCKYCGKGFSRARLATEHERIHTGEKPYVCTTCGKSFSRYETLTIHIRTHSGERPYQCTYCDKAFTQSNDLKVHIRRHTGERFKCEFCDKSFIQMHLLKRHQRMEHKATITS